MKHCTTDKCPQIVDSSCVFYEGASLIFSGINTNESVEVVIQKLNLKLESTPIVNLSNYYNKTEIDTLINNIDLSNYYTKTETNLLLENYYLKTETYSQDEVNNLLSTKQNNLGYTPENESNKSDSYTISSSTTYASTKALVDGLATKLNKGTYTGTAQDLKNEIDSKQKLLSSFDESILIENDGNIENNVSLFEEYFEQQECELNFTPIQIVAVYQDGIKLLNSEYEIILPKKIKIKEYVDENIQIEYTYLKS